MRKISSLVALSALLTVPGFALFACSQPTQPAQQPAQGNVDNERLAAALEKLAANNNGGTGTATSGGSGISREEFRALKDKVADVEALMSNIDTRLRALDRISQDLGTLKADSANVRDLDATIKHLKDVSDSLKAVAANIDPNAMIDLTKKLAEKEGALITLRGERDTLKRDADAANATLAVRESELSKLKEDYKDWQASDITRHPKVIDLNGEIARLKKDIKDITKKYEDLIAAYNDKEGITTSKTDDTGKPADSGVKPAVSEGFDEEFRALVQTAQLMEDGKNYVLLVNVTKGEVPASGEVLTIVDENGKSICTVRVSKAFSATQFGGMTVNGVTRPPIKEDIVKRSKQAKPAGTSNAGEIPGRSNAEPPTAGGTDGR